MGEGEGGGGGGGKSRLEFRFVAFLGPYWGPDWRPERIKEGMLELGIATMALSFMAGPVVLSFVMPFAEPAIHRDGFRHMASTT